MINYKYIASGLVIMGSTVGTTIGVASAQTPSANVGKSDIPKSIYRQDHLAAEAAVLNISSSSVQAAHKDKTMKQLITNSGLNYKTFHEDLRTKLTDELKSQGYRQDQITLALQHHHIKHSKK